MATVPKKPKKTKKRKGKIVIKEKAKIRKKGTENAKKDSMPPTPLPHDNGATLKIKIKRKKK